MTTFKNKDNIMRKLALILTAAAVLAEVQAALVDWSTLATQIGIPRREIAQFADRWSLAQTL